MDHEADDQEGAERQLAERERRADREPLAEVVQPDADGDEQRQGQAPGLGATAAQAPREKGHAQVAHRDAEQDEAGAAQTARERGLPVERLRQCLDAEEGQQPCRQRHERAQPRGARAPQRRQPEQPERNGEDADEEADDPVAEEAARRRGRRLDGRRDLVGAVSIPVELVTPTEIGSSSTQS